MSPDSIFFQDETSQSLRFGMTQYGEFATVQSAPSSFYLCGSTPCTGNAGLGVGSGPTGWTSTDVWAPSTINPQYYIQGWTFSMNFSYAGEGLPAFHHVYAFALFSNLAAEEGGRGVWSWEATPHTPVPAANNTAKAGYLTPSGIQVLYDSARLSVFRTSVVINDCLLSACSTGSNGGVGGTPVAQVTFTTVFQKDTKYFIVYKDVKILLPPKVLSVIYGLSFSERYELDLNAPADSGFVHYYPGCANFPSAPSNWPSSSGYSQSDCNTPWQTTVYQHPLTGDNHFDVVNAFDSAGTENFFAAYWPPTTEHTVLSSLVPSIQPNSPTIPAGSGGVPGTGSNGNLGVCNTFIDCEAILQSGTDIRDMPIEPSTPWVIAQWHYLRNVPQFVAGACNIPGDQILVGGAGRCLWPGPVSLGGPQTNCGGLTCGTPLYANMLDFLRAQPTALNQREIRFVEVAGLTALDTLSPRTSHDANVPLSSPLYATNGGGINRVDIEIQYLLQQVFNPTDLSTVNGAFETSIISEAPGCSISQTALPCYTNQPFLWNNVGSTAASVDSIGAALVSQSQRSCIYSAGIQVADATPYWSSAPLQNYCGTYPSQFSMFDKNNTNGGGSIPFGLKEFSKNVYNQNINLQALGLGNDATSYYRTSLQGFYDPTDAAGGAEVQPVAAGASTDGVNCYWNPSKSPMTEGYWVQSLCAGSWTFVGPINGLVDNENGIIAVGGPKANGIARYFNDYNFALDRESTDSAAVISSGGVATGTAPTSNPSISTFDFFAVSSWNSMIPYQAGVQGYSSPSATTGYAVISIAHDLNGTRGLSVYGWNGRDSFWASAWASQWLGENSLNNNNPFNWLPMGTTAIMLQIKYGETSGTWEAEGFNILQDLGTITQMGFNQFIATYGHFDTFTEKVPIGWTDSGTSAPIWLYPDHTPSPWAGNTFQSNFGYSQSGQNNVLPAGPDGITYYGPIGDTGAVNAPPNFDWYGIKIEVTTSASVQFDG